MDLYVLAFVFSPFQEEDDHGEMNYSQGFVWWTFIQSGNVCTRNSIGCVCVCVCVKQSTHHNAEGRTLAPKLPEV